MRDIYGNDEVIKGRPEWALGYGADKSDTGAILLVVEAKPYESTPTGMPQLLVYMAAVHKSGQNRVNNSVFGMASDSKEFRFAFLDEDKKFYTSGVFTWCIDQTKIIAYIDMMLNIAFESSPQIAPLKINNRTLSKYREFFGRQWKFGDEFDDERAREEDDDDDSMVDIINIGGRIVIKSHDMPRSKTEHN